MIGKRKENNRFSHVGKPGGLFLPLAVLLVLLSATPLQAGQDPIYDMCQFQSERPGPWCYQEAVEQRNQPELCENILEYWPKADGVHGWCYYQLAMKNRDCRLCERIGKADIKRMFRQDVCK